MLLGLADERLGRRDVERVRVIRPRREAEQRDLDAVLGEVSDLAGPPGPLQVRGAQRRVSARLSRRARVEGVVVGHVHGREPVVLQVLWPCSRAPRTGSSLSRRASTWTSAACRARLQVAHRQVAVQVGLDPVQQGSGACGRPLVQRSEGHVADPGDADRALGGRRGLGASGWAMTACGAAARVSRAGSAALPWSPRGPSRRARPRAITMATDSSAWVRGVRPPRSRAAAARSRRGRGAEREPSPTARTGGRQPPGGAGPRGLGVARVLVARWHGCIRPRWRLINARARIGA